jgi:hypothetical protein
MTKGIMPRRTDETNTMPSSAVCAGSISPQPASAIEKQITLKAANNAENRHITLACEGRRDRFRKSAHILKQAIVRMTKDHAIIRARNAIGMKWG